MKLKRLFSSLPLLLAIATSIIAQEQPQPLTILHTNDFHTHFLPADATWLDEDPPPQIGGITALKYYVEQEQAASEQSLLLDAGDWMTGTPLGDMEMGGAAGGGFIQLMNRIGFDATVIGNHELDGGIDNLERLIELLNCDVVTANFFRGDKLVAPHAYKIYRRGKLRIGVIGLILDDLFEVAPRFEGLKVHNTVKTAQKIIDQIDPDTDLILLLTHQGWQADSLLATQIHNADVIVGGHSHTRIESPRSVNNLLILQAGSYTRYLGRLDMTVQNDAIVDYNGELIPLWVEGIKPHPEVSRLVRAFEIHIKAEYGVEIGKASVSLGRSHYDESDLGNLLTDMLLASSGVDFALLNSGGIRANLAAGPVTRLNIAEILPFKNHLVRFNCSGKELLTFLKNNAVASSFEEQGIMQVAGLACEWRVLNGQEVKIVKATVAGKPIQPDRQYSGVTVDYALSKADRYFGFQPREQVDTKILLSDAIMDYIKEHPQIKRPVSGRLREVR
ncbi:MAG: bifunctional metallophosphatase/5'-nucleotidase [Pirellulales bacterium]|nr:bifunctional metallophosphatase/5'-nucleotidase [Pirellulales bacterium]